MSIGKNPREPGSDLYFRPRIRLPKAHSPNDMPFLSGSFQVDFFDIDVEGIDTMARNGSRIQVLQVINDTLHNDLRHETHLAR